MNPNIAYHAQFRIGFLAKRIEDKHLIELHVLVTRRNSLHPVKSPSQYALV